MADYGSARPIRGQAYTFEVGLTSQSDTKTFQSNPTLATGDVKVSKDGGATANLTTLPTAIGSGKLVTVSLSASEMTADRVAVIFADASGAEWCDLIIYIDTSTGAVATAGQGRVVDMGANRAGVALPFLAFFADDTSAGVTGLTVTVDVYRGATKIVTADSASEVGGGLYRYTLAAANNTGANTYTAVFKTTATTVANKQVAGAWAVADWVDNLNDLAANPALYTPTSVAENLHISVIAGDDYSEADGTNISWSSTGWPDLTGAVVIFIARDQLDNSSTFTANCSVNNAGEETQTVVLEMAATVTDDLALGGKRYRYKVEATLASGGITTLTDPETGFMTVKDGDWS